MTNIPFWELYRKMGVDILHIQVKFIHIHKTTFYIFYGYVGVNVGN